MYVEHKTRFLNTLVIMQQNKGECCLALWLNYHEWDYAITEISRQVDLQLMAKLMNSSRNMPTTLEKEKRRTKSCCSNSIPRHVANGPSNHTWNYLRVFLFRCRSRVGATYFIFCIGRSTWTLFLLLLERLRNIRKLREETCSTPLFAIFAKRRKIHQRGTVCAFCQFR